MAIWIISIVNVNAKLANYIDYETRDTFIRHREREKKRVSLIAESKSCMLTHSHLI